MTNILSNFLTFYLSRLIKEATKIQTNNYLKNKFQKTILLNMKQKWNNRTYKHQTNIKIKNIKVGIDHQKLCQTALLKKKISIMIDKP